MRSVKKSIKIVSYIIILGLFSGVVFAADQVVLFHRADSIEDAGNYIAKIKQYSDLDPEYFEISQKNGAIGVIYRPENQSTAEAYNRLKPIYPWIELIEAGSNFPAINSIDPPQNISENQTSVSVSIQRAFPETVTNIELSNSQINRIIGPRGHSITDVVIPKDDGIQAKIQGRNIFITYKTLKNSMTGVIQKRSASSEMYIVVDDTVYTLIAAPKSITAATVELVLGSETIEKNKAFFKDMPLEKKAVALIQAVVNDTIPDHFSQQRIGKAIDALRDYNLYYRRAVKVDGEGLVLKEFIVGCKTDGYYPLQEKMFLLPEISKQPIGIALEDMVVSASKPTRLFVVDKVN